MQAELAASAPEKEMRLLYGKGDAFGIYQLKDGDGMRDYHFEPYDRLQAAGLSVEATNYNLVYTAELTPGTSLEDIFTRFNIDRPEDFKGHSLSVSDIVVLHQNGENTAHYVDSIGYRDVPEFLREQPAIAAEQPENYLKAAEQTTEQNANMIDGVINNTPNTDALEAKANAGEQISLEQYAETQKQDEAAEPDTARITATAKNRCDGMVALFTMDDKIYIGKSENYDSKVQLSKVNR